MTYETVEVPFKRSENRRYLTEKQVAELPWLLDFMRAFPDCFEMDDLANVFWYYD